MTGNQQLWLFTLRLRNSTSYFLFSIVKLDFCTESLDVQVSKTIVVLSTSPFIFKIMFFKCRTRSKRLNSLSKRQRRDIVVGTVLIIIVCIFIICHSLKFVINMVELCAVVAGKNDFFPRKCNLNKIAQQLFLENFQIHFSKRS